MSKSSNESGENTGRYSFYLLPYHPSLNFYLHVRYHITNINFLAIGTVDLHIVALTSKLVSFSASRILENNIFIVVFD